MAPHFVGQGGSLRTQIIRSIVQRRGDPPSFRGTGSGAFKGWGRPPNNATGQTRTTKRLYAVSVVCKFARRSKNRGAIALAEGHLALFRVARSQGHCLGGPKFPRPKPQQPPRARLGLRLSSP